MTPQQDDNSSRKPGHQLDALLAAAMNTAADGGAQQEPAAGSAKAAPQDTAKAAQGTPLTGEGTSAIAEALKTAQDEALRNDRRKKHGKKTADKATDGTAPSGGTTAQGTPGTGGNDGKATAGQAAQQQGQGDGAKAADGAQDDGHDPLKSFAQIVKERATEGDSKPNAATSLRSIINGDILYTEIVRKQIWVFLLITAFVIVYITNRYACQRDLVKIDKLNKELTDVKFRALSSTSELTEKSRESRVLDMLRACNDSTLHIASQPPYIITVPDDDDTQ